MLDKSICHSRGIGSTSSLLLSTPKGVDYVVIGFDLKVQPLVTHNAV